MVKPAWLWHSRRGRSRHCRAGYIWLTMCGSHLSRTEIKMDGVRCSLNSEQKGQAQGKMAAQGWVQSKNTKSHSKNKFRLKLSLGNLRFCLKNIITWRAASKKATPSLHLPEVELWKRNKELFNHSQFALGWILTTSTIMIKKVNLPALQSFSPSKASSRQVSLSPSAIALIKGIWIYYLLLIMALQIALKIGIWFMALQC